MSKLYIVLIMALFSCFSLPEPGRKNGLVDAKATKQTVALFNNLQKLSEKHILFGHQHATEYGHGWYGQEGRSDVKSVTGSHPAVIGIDFSGLSGRSQD